MKGPEEEFVQQRIQALERELEYVKRRIAMGKPSKEEVEEKIREYELLVEKTSRLLKVTEDPDTYIARLRAKEY